MANVIKVPETVKKRLIEQVPSYQRVLKEAQARGDNEANTGKIVVNMLSDVFGFDKFKDLDKEYKIAGGDRCDVAVKIEGKVRYLVEVKAIGRGFTERHFKQVEAYGDKAGIQWVVLTNGVDWRVYRVWEKGRGKNKKLTREQVCALNFEDVKPKTQEGQEKLFMLCRRGVKKALFEELYDRQQVVNEHTIAALLMMSDEVHKIIARELKKQEQNAKPGKGEIAAIITERIVIPGLRDDEKTESERKKIVKKAVGARLKNQSTRAANENTGQQEEE